MDANDSVITKIQQSYLLTHIIKVEEAVVRVIQTDIPSIVALLNVL